MWEQACVHYTRWTLFPMKCDDAKLLHVCTCINCQVLHIPFLGCKFSLNTFLDGLKTMLLPRKVRYLQLFRVEPKKSPISFLFQCNGHSISQFSIQASVFKCCAWNPYGHTMDARTPDMETHDNVCVSHFVSIKHPSEGCHQRQKSHKARDTFLTPLSNPRDL